MIENIFEFPYFVLTCLGLWAIESKNRWARLLYCVYQCWAIMYLVIFTSFLLWDLYSVRRNVHKSSTNLSATMTTLMLLWKNSQGLQKLPRLQQLQKKLNKGLRTEVDDRDRVIMQKAKTEIKLACTAVYILGACTLTSWVASGLLLKSKHDVENLPLPVFVPWNHLESPYYEFALGFQVYGGYFVTLDVLSFNLTIFGTIIQICAEYDRLLKNIEMINEWFEGLGGTKMSRVLNKEENHEVLKMIVENIRHHQKIIHCANESENCYTHMMIVQFAGSVILLTVVSLDLILVTKEINSRLLPLIIFLLLIVSDIYLFCHYGSRLINKSHLLQTSVYGIPWEYMNGNNRKVVSLIIFKAERPPKLTVEKFANIDKYSLLQLIKAVYNVLYLLLHIAKDR